MPPAPVWTVSASSHAMPNTRNAAESALIFRTTQNTAAVAQPSVPQTFPMPFPIVLQVSAALNVKRASSYAPEYVKIYQQIPITAENAITNAMLPMHKIHAATANASSPATTAMSPPRMAKDANPLYVQTAQNSAAARIIKLAKTTNG